MLPSLAELWLPILLSGVFVFLVSSAIHMVLQIHKGDWKKLAQEDRVLTALRDYGVGPGEYMFPCAGSMKEMSSPEMVAKLERGPVGTLIVLRPGGFSIGKSLLQWFVFTLVISLFAAYLGHLALPRGAAFTPVLRLTGAAAVLGYAFSNVTDSIWKGVSWGTTLKFVFDGIVYGLVTGATFAWLWPAPLV